MDIVKTFFGILNQRERKRLFLLFAAVLVMAGLEVVSVASIMPFLSVAADPSTVHDSKFLSWAYDSFGFSEMNTFLAALGFGALAALVLSNTFIIFTTWALQKYVWSCNHSLSQRLLRTYLSRPYGYFLGRNSSELGKNILQEVKEVATGMLKPALHGSAKAIVGLFIIGFLFFVDPIISVSVSVVLGSTYAVMYIVLRNKLKKIGEKRVSNNTERYQIVAEAFGGIKQVKLRGKEESFVGLFSGPSEEYSDSQAKYAVIKKAPRYLLEMVAFGGIVIIALYLIFVRENLQSVIPVLGLYAFAGYRLMPALQKAFNGLASARFNKAALEKIREDIVDYSAKVKSSEHIGSGNSGKNFELDHGIELENVSYKYPQSRKRVVKSLSLKIEVGTTVGFLGETGSGKTTTVDLIIGLLRPTNGEIYLDGKKYSKIDLKEWQSSIGYVPQEIFLTDGTIASNIAFGVEPKDINMSRVKKVSRVAKIYSYIKNDLSEGWDTNAGEKGVKLSGGQRQRIGIARALYHEPSVLVFDEATSALDQKTEKEVVDRINNMKRVHTIISIAHRLKSLKTSDKVIVLENGRKVEEGSYSRVVEERTVLSES
jgi:ATP-binding cassette subfamily C protein